MSREAVDERCDMIGLVAEGWVGVVVLLYCCVGGLGRVAGRGD